MGCCANTRPKPFLLGAHKHGAMWEKCHMKPDSDSRFAESACSVIEWVDKTRQLSHALGGGTEGEYGGLKNEEFEPKQI